MKTYVAGEGYCVDSKKPFKTLTNVTEADCCSEATSLGHLPIIGVPMWSYINSTKTCELYHELHLYKKCSKDTTTSVYHTTK